MAEQYAPIAKDSSLNTTDLTPKNIADVLKDGLATLASSVKPTAANIDFDPTGTSLSSNKVEGAIKETLLKKKEVSFTLADYSKYLSWRTIGDVPTDHNYLFATVVGMVSGGASVSPFIIIYEGFRILLITGSVEPVSITVAFWYQT